MLTLKKHVCGTIHQRCNVKRNLLSSSFESLTWRLFHHQSFAHSALAQQRTWRPATAMMMSSSSLQRQQQHHHSVSMMSASQPTWRSSSRLQRSQLQQRSIMSIFPKRFVKPNTLTVSNTPKRTIYMPVSTKPVFTAEQLSNQAAHPNLYRLVTAYRSHAHVLATIDPLRNGQPPEISVPELTEAYYGLSEDGTQYNVDGVVYFPDGRTHATLTEIVHHLKKVYTRSLSAESSYTNAEEREWLAQKLESTYYDTAFSPAQKRNFHAMLVKCEAFDQFLGTKFVSFKRYGMEGAEAALVGLSQALESASQHGVEDVVLGMPHRGRLNILVGLLDYSVRAVCHKIFGNSDIPKDMKGNDDVISHIAQSVTKKFDNVHPLHVSLIHNPSHLEAVNAVSLGKTKAKQMRKADADGVKSTMCVQLHGDAAFSGQGCVYEALLLADLPSYSVGGTVHMIVNNQIGYTTLPPLSRSSLYSSDPVKIIQAPALHVNGDDVEAVAFACRIAVEFRNTFHRDIMVDVVAYRKHGHNEVDEPSFTQPLMYENIRSRPSTVTLYAQKLKEEKLLSEESDKKLKDRLQAHLLNEFNQSFTFSPISSHFQGHWKGFQQVSDVTTPVQTGVDTLTLATIGKASVMIPPKFTVHPRLARTFVAFRQTAMAGEANAKVVDWATAEALAWGSLLAEGYHVRISGQDVERGTFSQRHGVVIDQKSEEKYAPLNHLTSVPELKLSKQGTIQYCCSPLSEFAVLAFEYGYSIDDPKTLVIWEAQFGDFFNGAQIPIDAFFASGEDKWLRQSGLVLVLPHGFDGAGPEHSSCRMERFLQMTDGDEFSTSQKNVNFYVANPTTPANYFHLLRRQMLPNFRKPLVIVGPKTLLRHSDAVSSLSQMAPGTTFRSIIPDKEVPPSGVQTVVLCSGKFYYDVVRERTQQRRNDIALIRVEELAPFPFEAISEQLKTYTRTNSSKKMRLIWLQEEPANKGAWSYVNPRLARLSREIGGYSEPVYVGRAALPSPAVGVGKLHKLHHDNVISNLWLAADGKSISHP